MHLADEQQVLPLGLSTDRVEALSDGVFAIAITLLVLTITVPNVLPSADGHISWEQIQQFGTIWRELLSYVISFVVVGVYWVGQRNQFFYIQRADRVLVWLNLFFLLFVAFIPFSAGLIGKNGTQQIAVVVYGINLILTGLMLFLHWSYATHHRQLVSPDLERHVIRDAKVRILIAPLAYLVAIGFSFIRPELSLAVYALVPLYYILPGHIDQHFQFRPFSHRQRGISIPGSDAGASLTPGHLKGVALDILQGMFGGTDAAIIDKHFAPQFHLHNPSYPEEVHGPQGMQKLVATYRTAFPDLEFIIADQIAEGNTVVTRWQARGTHQGELLGLAPTGKAVAFSGIDIQRFTGEQVIEAWSELDALGLMQQVGAIPMADPNGANPPDQSNT